MSDEITYETLPEIPGLLGLYGKAAGEQIPVVGTSRDGKSMPSTGYEVSGISVDAANLAAYTQVSRLRLGDELPLTYPFTMSFPLAMSIMTGKKFPFAAMGSVHLKNVIESRVPLHVGDELNLRVHAENLREHPSGLLVDMVSEIRTAAGGDEPAWRQVSSFLSKRRTSLTPPKDAPRPPKPEPPTAAELGNPTVVREVTPQQIGVYAEVSGDRNPIHVSAVGAKAFGFPNVIAHGMWTAATLLGTVEGRYSAPVRYTVEFGKPVVLPTKLAFYAREGVEESENDGWTVTVRDPRKPGKVHATGTLENL